ncbi:MAG: 1-acyl-sn-glycerol-3-phosphate acyltransferase [Clostridia bacterium]|nr:1-acyl-sn-glycerol-3-phosphate acyltransferase [Clostridia bacterium]
MKIKTKTVTPEYALNVKPPKRRKLKQPSRLFQTLVRVLSVPALWATKFTYTKSRMEEAGKGPWLILMNHSSFLDLKIASKLLYPKRYFIVSTSDGLVGKEWLMRKIGCIPTQKFTTDVPLALDMLRAVQEKKTSVLLFPEAGYTFDGRTTTLPKSLGAMVKKLGVPVVTAITDGAFLYQPLYNDLRVRKVKASAHMQCLLTAQEVKEKSADEIGALIDEIFSFDNFRKQYDTKTKISEPFRAQGLHRILYRCPQCGTEGEMLGEGTSLVCGHCGKAYEMDVYGRMSALEGETEFPHIPDWYDWERECVRRELEEKTYRLGLDVDIAVLADYKALYKIGSGRLIHDENGFVLTDCDGKLEYKQAPLASYGLNSDFYWYEMGDVICIGDKKRLYYCFPKQEGVVVKARFAAEELYKKQKLSLKKR